MNQSFKSVIYFSCVAVSLLACKDKFDNHTVTEASDLTVKEISVPVKSDPSFAWAPGRGTVRLGDLQADPGKEPILLTIGNGVAAGYRDGGLFRQGQLTSYPNLVAKQMGLTNFNQALFEKEESNGTGYLVKSDSQNLSGWSKVTNNLGYTEKDGRVMKPYSGGSVHNLSIPGNHPNKYFINPNEHLSQIIDFYKQNPGKEQGYNANHLWTSKELSATLMSRMFSQHKGSVWDYLNGMKPDVAIVDINSDIYIYMHIFMVVNEVYWV